jgi:hypothetical protein
MGLAYFKAFGGGKFLHPETLTGVIKNRQRLSFLLVQYRQAYDHGAGEILKQRESKAAG